MARTPENRPGRSDRGSKFTEEQINQALAALEAEPELIKELISSAQGGNQDDLRFLAELGDRNIVLDFDSDGGFIDRR